MALTKIRQEQGVVINEGSTDVDFRVESNGNANMLFVDAGNDKVGIGTGSPSEKLHVQGDGADLLLTDAGGGQTAKLGATGSNNGILELNNSSHTSTVVLNTSGDSYLNGGNVGIGTASPTNTSGYTTANIGAGTVGSIFKMDGAASGFYHRLINNNGDFGIQADQGNAKASTNITFAIDGTERMRIDSSGNLLVAKTASDLTTVGIVLHSSGYISTTASGGKAAYFNRTGADGDVVSILNDGTAVGSISVDGSATAYNTSSDYRLKENVDYSWDATTRLKQLKPARFNFISDDTNTLVDGFIAHEVSSIVPEAITGEKDAVDSDGNPEYQGIDHSKLVPLLVKTIQELEARITALE